MTRRFLSTGFELFTQFPNEWLLLANKWHCTMCTDNVNQNDDHDLPISIKLSRSTSSYDCRICSDTHTHIRPLNRTKVFVCVCECIEPHRISGEQLDFLYFSYAPARVRVQICNRTNGKINNKNPNATQTHQWVTVTAIHSFTTQLRNYTLVCVRACVHCAELLRVFHVKGRQRKESPMESNRHRASGELCKQNFTPIDTKKANFCRSSWTTIARSAVFYTIRTVHP